MSLSNQAMESLLQAIDIIADKRAKENTAYNQTVICYITDNSHAEKQGYYTVSNDTLTFDAYSDNPSYKVGAYVRVTIPNGDYSQQKYIEGLYAYNDGEALTYVSPLDTFLDAADLIDQRASADTLVSGAIGLAANNVRTTTIPIWEIKLSDDPSYQKLQANGIYDTLGLQADFKCLLGKYDMRSGSYGLRLDLNVKLNENTEFSVIHSIYLDSSTMFGNPYNFSVFTTQAQTYDISTIGTITGATLYLYQNNDFTYYDSIKKQIVSVEFNSNTPPNIFVSNLYIAFGSDLYKVPDNTLKLYTKDSLTYKYNDYSEATNKKAMSLLWYNKNEYDQYVGFGDGIYDEDYDEIQYLSDMKINNRLLSQQGNEEEIPNTREGLTASANINDAIPLLKDIQSFLDGKLIRNLSNFKRRLFGCAGEAIVDAWIFSINTIKTELPAQTEALAAAVKGLLKDGGAVSNPTISSTILNNIDGIFKLESSVGIVVNENQQISEIILQGSGEEDWVFAPGILTLTENGYSSYRGIYDNFQIIMLPLFSELKTKYEKLVDLIYGIEIMASGARNGTPFIPIDDSQYANRYSIYWYRYDPSYYDETEPFMEAGWKPIEGSAHIGRPTEADSANPEFLMKKCNDSENILYQNMDPYCQTEKFRVVLCYNHEIYFSNILEFTNEDVVPDGNELYKVDALYLEHGSQSHATYQTFYASNYGLANMGEASRDRAIKLSCKEEYGGDKVLGGAQVYWYVPNTTTMLTYNKDILTSNMGFIAMDPDTELSDGSEYRRDGYICFYKTIPVFPESETDIEAWKENLNFYYRIKDYFVPTSLRNTILCHIVSNGLNIEVELPITFGTLGSSGTDYTLVVMPATSQKCVSTEVNEDGQIKSGDLLLTVALYDYDNNLVAFASDDKLQLKWIGPTSYNNPVGPSISADGTAEIIIPAIGVVGSHTGILQVTYPMTIESTAEVEDAGFSKKRIVDISTQYPISWGMRDSTSLTKETYYIEGATSIVYDAMGTNPVYYKNPYKIYNSSHQQIPVNGWTIKWYDKDGQMILADSPEYNFCKNYLPSMTKIHTLVPCNTYVHDCEYYPVVEAFNNDGCIWAQPIVILQNRYPSAMLNSWDGDLTIDEKNGTILSTMVGAGKKEIDNSFSGVLMGNVELADIETDQETYNRLYSRHSGLGLYGFHHGAQSFGFNVDGTAFIGKSGGGRISFDGNYGFLYSANWLESFKKEKYDENGLPITYYDNPFIKEENGAVRLNTGKAGMAIDLQNGHIDAYDFKLSSNGINLSANPDNNDGYYFKVGNNIYNLAFDKDGNLILNIKDIYGIEGITNNITNPDGSLSYYLTNVEDPNTTLGFAMNRIKETVNAKLDASEYTADKIWETLTDGGKRQGGVFDDSGNYYISASVMSTGVLKSANVEVNKNSDGTYSLEVAEGKTGVYMDLNKGLLWANEFDLLVQPTYVDIMQGNKAAIILTNQPKVKSSNEATTNQKYYLYIGNSKGYLSFDDKYNLTVSGNVIASAGNIGGWEITPSSLVAPNKNLHVRPDMIFGGMVVPEELKFLAVGRYDIDISGEVTNYETSDASHYNFAYEIMTDEAFTVKASGEPGFFLMDEIPSTNKDYSTTLLEPDEEHNFSIEENNLGRIILISKTILNPFGIAPDGFILTSTGKLYAAGADLSGRITATSGKIGGWTISTNMLSADGITLRATTANSESGTKVINAGNSTFYVRKDGYMYSSSGEIGGWSIGKNTLSANGITLTANASANTTKVIDVNSGTFYVQKNGYMYSSSGSIGGWSIGTSQLSSGSGSSYVALNSSSDNSYAIWAGSATNSSAPFSVTKAGALKSTKATIIGNITATGGSIGGWIIDDSYKIKDPILGTTLYSGPVLYAQNYTSEEQGKITDPQDANSSIEVEVKYRTFFTPRGVIMEYQYFSGQNENYQEGDKIGNPWYKDCRWTEIAKYVSPF